ncbi:hypothetical protein KM427_00350 [Nocardioides sp. LMS-CY]|uniref:hypothetical protein n=1 Tax=Nocardioides sp. (strain LMS-CY) TaxID=2840457 RepID=UPI001BFFE9CB|nr:hypothetical protein [Nocardioides sp. LMS-CY]QWF22239.1 hypothetical protein KM427_00350 [Nocardioides sp. LMS-CY]
MESEADGESDLLAKYGVTDEASGRQRAEQAREYLLIVARSVIQEGAFTIDHLIVAGMVARAQSLHEAALSAINSNNPHAALTLLRAYIEQCAAALYLTDHPDRAERLWNDLDGHGVPIGRITSHADRSGRLGQFRRVYDQLSKYAHPSSISHFAGMRVGEGRELTFQTAARFKRDEEKLVAYAWLIEFAYTAHVFLFEFAKSKGLGKIVRPE